MFFLSEACLYIRVALTGCGFFCFACFREASLFRSAHRKLFPLVAEKTALCLLLEETLLVYWEWGGLLMKGSYKFGLGEPSTVEPTLGDRLL